jgi:hypothetical protein
MAYDETVANRVRRALGEQGDFDMCCGIVGSEIMVRVGPDGYAEALAAPHARPMDFTGRPLTGMVYVGSAGFKTEAALDVWVGRGLAFVLSLRAREPSKLVAKQPRPRSR